MPTDRNLNSFTTLTPPGTKPVVNSIMRDVSAEALAELRLWLEQNPPAIGISNILGFQQFTANGATTISTQETTASAVYTDLATVGPQITGLSDGKYVIIFGCTAKTSASGIASLMSVDANGGGAVDGDSAQTQATDIVSISRAITKTLSAGSNNTITAKYRSAGTGTFSNRWMIAIRYANK